MYQKRISLKHLGTPVSDTHITFRYMPEEAGRTAVFSVWVKTPGDEAYFELTDAGLDELITAMNEARGRDSEEQR